ncbi:hypothetical protein SAMN02745126_01145 [Enhydrobacter aerosaccus]|uniref:Uncharacterized protein n=1 Tax=Enhydrobacter aerosaccus TaxID=225324 RepID=A0A1T4KTW7_9HYPH|nr:hypothetical protein [Enhydrobacter aerosaccus]SJZ45800.1 hypothetical protein SAMN02745126_01145 [Enhydrobacter aerosaccus]
MELDKDRLAKLLNLTQSEHDGEVLAAIRKANDFLRLHKASWSDALGVVQAPAASATTPPQEADIPTDTSNRGAPPAPPPPGYLPSGVYRDAFRREPLLPRLLGFPFWLLVELLAVAAPNMLLNVRGTWLAAIFTLSMMLGIVAWIALAYSLVVGFG